LPSGYCEADEPPRVAAVREAAEETGLTVQAGALAGAYYFDDDPRGSGLLLVYEARAVGGRLGADGQENVAAGYFAPDDLPRPLCGGGHDRAIADWQAGRKTRAPEPWQPGSPLRYCPHCTHALEVRLAFDRQRPVCPACGFVHFRAAKVGVSLFVEREGQVLLIQRAIEPGLDKWALPSGFVEWDESPEAAAIRECREETGLVVADLELLDVYHYADDYRGAGINIVYRATAADGRPQAGDDARAARYFSWKALPPDHAIAFRGHRLMLACWRDKVPFDKGCGS
jgi:ADP-ribose pyrophosphatase YjhB (NUDIX family)